MLDSLQFDNSFIRSLPGDPQPDNFRREVRWSCYSRVQPTPVTSPSLVGVSPDCAELLDLGPEDYSSAEFTTIFSGNGLLPDMEPFAMCYGGHQFGSWAGQLGDGRAINLGEIVNQSGQRWLLQLKGAGPTPYSRRADGLAVLRSSIREFLCSEAMHFLGVPTTRALSVIATGEKVLRDMFYDGHPQLEPGAVVCRVAPSFLRFGNYEILTARGEIDLLQQLVDYTIRTDFPAFSSPAPTDAERYLDWFGHICQLTATLMVQWMRVGFVHGVMNTDNMSILGLTIDYGPYGWLEGYDPNWTPNTTDAQGRRYCFGNQPQIGQWNLYQLANSLYPLIKDEKGLVGLLGDYNRSYQDGYHTMMCAKLGLSTYEQQYDEPLLGDLLTLLEMEETDMTIFFRKLADVADGLVGQQSPEPFAVRGAQLLEEALYSPQDCSAAYQPALRNWLQHYYHRLQRDRLSATERHSAMNRVNPKYVLRNFLAQQAIDKAENGDNSMVTELLEMLRHPYDEQTDKQHYFCKRPEWARNRPGCSMLSCSS